jgi:hypothetical protein
MFDMFGCSSVFKREALKHRLVTVEMWLESYFSVWEFSHQCMKFLLYAIQFIQRRIQQSLVWGTQSCFSTFWAHTLSDIVIKRYADFH